LKLNLTMKKLNVFALIVLLVAACAQGNSQSQVLSTADYEKKLVAITDKQVVDVRTQGEYNNGHLAGAVLIDYYKDDFKAKLSKLDKNKPVFVYCAAGSRSGSASDLLAELGFKQIYDLKGGMNAWARAGKPITK
jgi:rhodanese-related sulfurtransferase